MRAKYVDSGVSDGLLRKWKKILDFSSDTVAPITESTTRLNTAMLLENQESWCLNEANVSGSGGVFGGGSSIGGGFDPTGGPTGGADNYAQGDARLPKVLIPMIRRTFPELITNEIVGVQPMSGPIGLAFAMRYKYESDPLGGATGSGNDSSNGNGGQTWWADTDAKEMGYNDLDTRFTGAPTDMYAQDSGNTVANADIDTGKFKQGEITDSTGTTSDAFPMIGQDLGLAQLMSEFELTSNIPQAELAFEKTAVEAGTRRLAAKWSVELEQDIRNMNGIDIDTELTNTMSYEIQAEIDREMIMRMVNICLKSAADASIVGITDETARNTAMAGAITRNSIGASIWDAGTADGRWIGERTRDFYAKIIVEANRISVRNRRGAANFIVSTPNVCAMIEMLPEFKTMPVNSGVSTGGTGIAKLGTLGGRFTVYRDTRTEAQFNQSNRGVRTEYALLGYKGSEYYDTGMVYCPYIPVMVQRTIGPNDFAPRVGLLTRYGVVDNLFGADLYYHMIIVRGLGETFVQGTANGTKIYM